MNINSGVIALVVTHNRRSQLSDCIAAVNSQTVPPAHLLIVDNASTDDTPEWIAESGLASDPCVTYVRTSVNLGGAGGFAKGMEVALSLGAEWVWMMDDDAAPAPSALERLLEVVGDRRTIYGSIAVTVDGNLCWPVVSALDGVAAFDRADRVPRKASVISLPFLGIFVSREVIEQIGYPDAGYFIAGDDTEYCFRARECGISIIAVGESRIQHPPSAYYRFGFGDAAPYCFRMPPWKRYYDVRNRILTVREQGLLHLFRKTLPGTVLRLMATLINEPQPARQLLAYVAGTLDGLRGLKGMRHQLWRISV